MAHRPNNVPSSIGVPGGAPNSLQAIAAFLTQLVGGLNNWIAQAANAINANIAAATAQVGSTLAVTDGTHTVSSVSNISIAGSVVGGTTPNATVTIEPDLVLGVSTNGFVTRTGAETYAIVPGYGNATELSIGNNSAPVASGPQNVSLGPGTLTNFSSSSGFNVAIGYNAGHSLTTGTSNTAIGAQALANETTGVGNFALGTSTLQNANGSGNNVGIGQNVLTGITTGTDNVAIGAFAINVGNTTNNTAIGASALAGFGGAPGGFNVAIGTNALSNGAGGVNATVGIGVSAGVSLGNSQTGVIIGHFAGQHITTGNNNTILGYLGATTLTTGSNCITIGGTADVATAGGNNQLNIGGAITGVMGTQLTVSSPLAFAAQIATIYDFVTPLTGTTVAASTNSVGMVVNPAGTIAALTIKLPASPVDGQIFKTGFTQTVTAVTWQDSAGGSNVVGSPPAGSVGLSVEFVFHSATSKWYIF